MIPRILASSRFFVAIGALGAFVSAVALLVYGALAVTEVVWTAFAAGHFDATGAEHLAVELIRLTDLLLLGTVLYIVAIGLYELFVDPNLPVPAWLHIANLDDLKAKLIQVVVVLLGVTFLGYVVERAGEADVLDLGAAIALVVAAFALIIFVTDRSHGGGAPPA